MRGSSRRAFLGLSTGLVASLVVPGCRRPVDAQVLAAASLGPAFAAIAAEVGGHPCTLSVAGSQVLATQILEGAPVDLFAAANAVQMERAQASGRLQDAQPFAVNTVVIAVSSQSATPVTVPTDLDTEGLRLVLAAAEVPAGRYGRQALERAGLESALSHVVSEEDSVQGVVTKLVTGEADAGLVYRTDTTAYPDELTLIELPETARVQATYGVALAREAHPNARRFLDTLRSEAGIAILERFGFGSAA